MGIKIVATVELEYEIEDDESPLHPLNIANLQTLCGSCNSRKGAR